MTIILEIARHTAESCPGANEKARKVVLEVFGNMEVLLKKHGVKVIGGWNVHPEHLTIMVYEAPSFEAFQKFRMEPEIDRLSYYQTSEYKIAMSAEEVLKFLKQVK
jgi:hypothetical protein